MKLAVRSAHVLAALWVGVVGRQIAVEDGLAPCAAPAPGKLVPHGAVHGVVARVQTGQGDVAPRLARQHLGQLETALLLTCRRLGHDAAGSKLSRPVEVTYAKQSGRSNITAGLYAFIYAGVASTGEPT